MKSLSQSNPDTKFVVKNLRPEAELLLRCVSVQFDLNATPQPRQFPIQQEINWEYLLEMAEKHRVIPLLYQALKSLYPDSVPSTILEKLRRRFHENVRVNLVLTHEMFRLLPIFENQGIHVLPYKGTVLAAFVYGKIGFRQVWDIDLLVCEQDFLKSRALLLSEGYRLKENYDREQSFVHPSKNIEIDLHWGFTPFYFPVNLNFESLWQRAELLTLSGATIKSFCAEDLLLILCIQVAKDCWERRQHLEHLAKVCDIAQLLHTRSELNWSQVIKQARLSGSLRMLHFGLFLAKSLLDAKVPEAIWLQVKADSLAISLAYQVCAELFGEIDKTFASLYNSLFDLKFRLKQMLFYLKMREHPKYWLRYFLEIGRTVLKLSQ